MKYFLSLCVCLCVIAGCADSTRQISTVAENDEPSDAGEPAATTNRVGRIPLIVEGGNLANEKSEEILTPLQDFLTANASDFQSLANENGELDITFRSFGKIYGIQFPGQKTDSKSMSLCADIKKQCEEIALAILEITNNQTCTVTLTLRDAR